MGKSAPSAPAPDPNIGIAALKQAETGQAWLDFSKDAFAVSEVRQKELDAITKTISQQQIDAGDAQFKWAKEDRARYENTFRPLEDKFIKDASEYGSQERQDAAASEARGDVLTAAAAERSATMRDQASMGVNPNSGRFAGVSRAGELGTALGAAGAENNARVQQRDKGLALEADVANMGRGLPAQSAQATALGLNAGGSAAGLYGAANSQYIASTGIMGQGYRGAMAGYAGQADALNKQYATQVDAWKTEVAAQNSATSGIMSGIGTIAGLGLRFMSDENMKEEKEPVQDGAALAALKSMPVEEWNYTQDSGQDPGQRHIGTYAQDFTAATGKGDGKTIAVQDALGLTMKAIQDLDAKVQGLTGIVQQAAKHEQSEEDCCDDEGDEASEGDMSGEKEGPAHERKESPAMERTEQKNGDADETGGGDESPDTDEAPGLGGAMPRKVPGLLIALAPAKKRERPTRKAA